MLRALNVGIFLVGIVLAIIGAAGVGLVFIIVGDVLVAGGLLLYLLSRRTNSPPSGLTG